MSSEEIFNLLKKDIDSLKREIIYLKCKVEEQNKKTKEMDYQFKNRTRKLIT